MFRCCWTREAQQGNDKGKMRAWWHFCLLISHSRSEDRRWLGENGPAICGGLHPSKTPSVDPNAPSLVDTLQRLLCNWGTISKQIQPCRKSESCHLPILKQTGAPGRAVFFYRGGLIYRTWSPKEQRCPILGPAGVAATMLTSGLQFWPWSANSWSPWNK